MLAAALLALVSVAVGGASPAAASDDSGHVDLYIDETDGRYIIKICSAPGEPVADLSSECSDGSQSKIPSADVPGGFEIRWDLSAGAYNVAIVEVDTLAMSPIGSVSIEADTVPPCWLRLTIAAAPACGVRPPPPPPPPMAGVAFTMTDPGSFIVGICRTPSETQTETTGCPPGQTLVTIVWLAGDGTGSVTLNPGAYGATVYDLSTNQYSPPGYFEVVAGETTTCAATMAGGPVCGDEPVDEDGDGIPDSEQKATLAPPEGTDGGEITLQVGSGTRLERAEVAPAPDAPPGVQAVTGLIGFTVTGLEPGSEAVVTLTMSEPTEVDTYWKWLDGRWVDATSSATFEPGGVVTLRIVDGGPFDVDGTANGVVIDPGMLAKRTPVTREACQNGGWRTLIDASNEPFRNQGACVSHAARPSSARPGS